LEVRRDLSGRITIDAPGVAYGGAVTAAVELPDALNDAIAHEITALLR
jgi:hypothetical protein